MHLVGDDDSDNEDMAGDARAAAAQAAYDRDRAARKARKAALAPVELAYEIDNTDAEQVWRHGGCPSVLGYPADAAVDVDARDSAHKPSSNALLSRRRSRRRSIADQSAPSARDTSPARTAMLSCS